MKTSSAKAKGRRLQDNVRDKILKKSYVYDDPTRGTCLVVLEKDDVKVAVMGETGLDIKLSPAARKVFPYGIECKNQEIFTTIYRYYEQAKANAGSLTPLLVICMNRKKPLVIMDFDDFMESR